MISPALQNLLDRAKKMRTKTTSAGVVIAKFSEIDSLTTLIELLAKQNEMLREAVEFMSMPVISKEATIDGLIESIENDCQKGKEVLDFCAKLDEQIAGLK